MSGWVDDFGDPHRPQLHVVTLGDLDDSGVQQLGSATGFYQHVIGQAVRRQTFGLTSVPPSGAEGLFLASGGRSDRGHLLGLEHPDHRPVGSPSGATVLYDASGNVIRAFMKDGLQLEAKAGGIWAKPAAGQNVYLGGKPGDGGTYQPVMTTGGASSNVYARVS